MGTRVIHWELADHVCRCCFGRILRSVETVPVGDAHGHRWRCSNCGAEAASTVASSICSCGLRLKGGRDAGIRCERNAEPTPEFPSEVVASQVAS